MTEYELADLLASVSGDSLVFLPLMISLVSGYLIVAWLVGHKLERSQVALVNTLFLSINLLFGFAWAGRIRVAMSYQTELLLLNPDRLPLIGEWLIPSASAFVAVTVMACLKFMWDIRHTNT